MHAVTCVHQEWLHYTPLLELLCLQRVVLNPEHPDWCVDDSTRFVDRLAHLRLEENAKLLQDGNWDQHLDPATVDHLLLERLVTNDLELDVRHLAECHRPSAEIIPGSSE